MRQECRLVLLTLVLCVDAPAQMVHKCVGRDGTASYQSQPCTRDAREVRTYEAAPEPPPTAEQLRTLEQRRARERAESAFLSRRAGTDRHAVERSRIVRERPAQSATACEAAKAARQQTLDVVGLKRNYELLSRLDANVRAACK